MSARARASAQVVLVMLAAAACSDRPDAPSPVQPHASSITSVSVTSTSPAWGDQGQTGEQVTINGSGFARGAAAAWALNGTVTSDVQVVSTQYVSSKQLVATVNIAPGATLAFYDVQVTNTTGTKGIGNDLFEVSVAWAVPGMATANGTNDNGLLVGNVPGKNASSPGDPALWTPDALGARTGTITDLGSVNTTAGAHPWAIDQAGTVIVGSGGPAYYWLKTGSGWTTAQRLPQDPATTVGYAKTLASDPTTGVARWVGGQEQVSSAPQPRMWSYDPASRSFTRYVLPFPAGATGGRVRGVNATGEGVGAAPLPNGDLSAAYWNASTGAAVLLPPAGNNSSAFAISADGSMIVGSSGGAAVYWTVSGGTFSGPYTLPGTGSTAVGIDGLGRIAGDGCATNARTASSVWLPPYTAVICLPGLGDRFNAGQVWSISPSGHNISGTASGGAAVWNVF